MRSLLSLRTRLPGSADRMLPPVPAIGALFLLVGAWAADVLTWVDTQQVPNARWDGPPRSHLDIVPVASGTIVAGAAVALLTALLMSRLGRRAAFAGAAATAAVPIAASAMLWPLPKGDYFGFPFTMSELLGVLLVLAVAAYRCAPLPVAGVAAVSASAFVSEWLRSAPTAADSSEAFGEGPVLAVGAGLTAGLYLRWRAEHQRARVERARQEERLSLARDLHDEVAHQITGIMVQVQALQHIGETRPDSAHAALPQIERAAARSLASMRRLVSALRDPSDAPSDNRGVCAALRSLEQPSASGGPRVDVALSDSVAELPPGVGMAVVRIAQEGVTNALRHARDATRVAVDVTAEEARVRLEVRDNGRGDAPSLRAGGGYGLVGMAERARLLGGETTAGPVAEGQGWRVLAELPVPSDQLAGRQA